MGGWKILLGRGEVKGSGNLTGSDFDHSNPFKSWKKRPVNIEHWLKSKLTWPVCTENMKIKMIQEQQL